MNKAQIAEVMAFIGSIKTKKKSASSRANGKLGGRPPMSKLEKVERLALRLMKQHGLHRWKFKWTTAKCRIGVCYHHTRTICLSKPFAAARDEAHSRDTILHEIAHALLPQRIDHGEQWKKMALKVGAIPKPYYDSSLDLPHKYELHCKRHGVVGHSHRLGDYSCPKCDTDFNPKFRLVFKLKTTSQVVKTPYQKMEEEIRREVH